MNGDRDRFCCTYIIVSCYKHRKKNLKTLERCKKRRNLCTYEGDGLKASSTSGCFGVTNAHFADSKKR